MPQDPFRYFRIEARELLEGLNAGVLALERGDAGADTLARLLRLAHTFKGAARVVRLPAIADRAHAIEEHLAPLRDQTGAVPAATIEALLALVDEIGDQVAAIPAAGETSAAHVATGETPAAVPAAAPAGAPAEGQAASLRIAAQDLDTVLERIAGVGTQLRAVADVTAELAVAVRQVEALREALPPEATAQAEALGESLARLQYRLSEQVDGVTRDWNEVRVDAEQLRLLPAGTVANLLDRTVRDAAAATGRKAELVLTGSDERLEANLLGNLRPALEQLVRNAVVHGIEPPDVRLMTGKPPTGRVEVRFERRGGDIVVSCRDDGRGLDEGKIRQAAIRQGLLPADFRGPLAPAELERLLLTGGFTTAEAASGVAGRGIGLDLVAQAAREQGGSVGFRSTPGAGTAFVLTLPANRSLIRALWVDAGGVRVLLPLDAVSHTRRLAPGDVLHRHPPVLRLDGSELPYLTLARALGQPLADDAMMTAVVISTGDRQAAIGVRRLLATTAVIMRPLPPLAPAAPVLAGTTVDDEGLPALVLSPEALVDLAVQGGDPLPAPVAPPAPAAPRPILVIDDSLTTRMLEQSILESAGYQVVTAASAEEALDRIRMARFSLFLVDVEMPGMDGFAFVGRVKADPAVQEVPVIMVTSRGDAADRERGLAAGAAAYVVKSEFNQAALLQQIKELVGR